MGSASGLRTHLFSVDCRPYHANFAQAAGEVSENYIRDSGLQKLK
jgi:hypothetical protein